MEPLAALGLASNVLQIVDFSTRLVSKSREIYRSSTGTVAEYVDAETVVSDLSHLNDKLRQSFNAGGHNASLTDDENNLKHMCLNCSAVANELLVRLSRVKISGKHRKWKSARQALKSVYSKDELEEIQGRLNTYRNEITLHITVSMRERIDLISLQHTKRFDELDSTTKDIMNAVSAPQEIPVRTDPRKDFFDAALSGNRSRLRAILNQGGIDINAKDDSGRTALHLASANGHDFLVQTLINNHARLEEEDNEGQSALHCAVIGLHWVAVRVLLSNGANRDAEDDHQKTPRSYLGLEKSENDRVCYWLFKHGHARDAKDDHGNTLLLFAAYDGFAHVARYLINKGVDLETTGDAGETPLIAASADGYNEVVEDLLLQGANLEATDRNGSTALIRAASRGHSGSVKALAAKGANLDATNVHQDSSLLISIDFNHVETVRVLLEEGANPHGSPLNLASKRGRDEIIPLLLEAGVDIERKDSGSTNALMLSAYHNRPTATVALLEHGADIEAKRNDSATALWLACDEGHKRVAQRLLARGADLESKAQHLAYPPISKAALQGHYSIVELLLERGANIEASNTDQVNALTEAACHCSLKIAASRLQIFSSTKVRILKPVIQKWADAHLSSIPVSTITLVWRISYWNVERTSKPKARTSTIPL